MGQSYTFTFNLWCTPVILEMPIAYVLPYVLLESYGSEVYGPCLIKKVWELRSWFLRAGL